MERYILNKNSIKEEEEIGGRLLLTGFVHLHRHSNIEEAIEDKNNNHIIVLFGLKFDPNFHDSGNFLSDIGIY